MPANLFTFALTTFSRANMRVHFATFCLGNVAPTLRDKDAA